MRTAFFAIWGSLALQFSVPAGAHPVKQIWNFYDGKCVVDCGYDGPDGNVRTFTANNGMKVAARAYNIGPQASFDSGFLGYYGTGLGVTANPAEDAGHPQHTLDNNGTYELIAFAFEGAVASARIYLQAYGDTDVSAWAGTTTGIVDLTGLSLAELSTSFTALGDDLGGHEDRWVNFDAARGNFLVIGTRHGDNDDYIKLGAMIVDQVDVPEPTSIGLLGAAVALIGLTKAGRRRHRSAGNDKRA